ncbi:MAG: glutamate 5-kinase, partial [Actinomycetota bacterium]|nr:glutamate 5-kinase [Actinomycetota bacterium]
MLSMPDARSAIRDAHRIVVKVGSSSITAPQGGIDSYRLQALSTVIARRWLDGDQVVLVSSGAIAAGMTALGLTRRPKDLATQQAAASAGQGGLVAAYSNAFQLHGLTVGQVLLTADDMHRRSHYVNASRTLERLLELEVVPIVNENDTVATEEIRFGDNDRLAALVAHLV